ncbi:MAG: RNA polymerase sigma factor [Gaiella sp.]
MSAEPSRQPLSDDVLVLRVARGDRPAYDELYRRYARATYGLALSQTADHEHAESMTREAFVAAWRRSSDFDPAVDEARDWLHEVALDAVTAHLERAPEAARADAGPPASTTGRHRWDVHRALADLPTDEAAVVEILTWGDVTLEAAGRHLGLPPETVDSRARSGHRRLAASLAPDDEAHTERALRALRDAGPPPELPPTLHDAPDPGAGSGVRRYRFTAVATAIVLGVVLFAVGYVLGGGSTPEQPVATATLAGAGAAGGAVTVLARDAGGNWPVELTVRGLPSLKVGDAYELLARTPAGSDDVVGRFRTAGARETTLGFSTPADVGRSATWIVVRAGAPDEVLLTSGGRERVSE